MAPGIRIVAALWVATLLILTLVSPRIKKGMTVLEEAPPADAAADAAAAPPPLPDPLQIGQQGSGARYIRYRADLKPFPDTGKHYDRIDPNDDLPYLSRRGLPSMDVRYGVPDYVRPYEKKGARPIFSADQAMNDLEALNEFDLVSGGRYAAKKHDIQDADAHPFGSATMFLPRFEKRKVDMDDPKGWTGAKQMCRDITTHINGLDTDGWASMSTLNCCSYLCSASQYKTLRDGELIYGLGDRNAYSSAIPTGTTVKLADGSQRYLCRTCAWNREPNWDQIGGNKLPKMEGHISIGAVAAAPAPPAK